MSNSKIIDVGYMTRVEGEAAIRIVLEGKEIEELYMKIWEPPRFFEGFLVGRKFHEVPDIVSRICGVCPMPHMITSLRALENALGITPSDQTRVLRRLMSLSQHLASHQVHLYVFVLPDYFRSKNIFEMGPEFQTEVQRFIRMKTAANNLTKMIGGRATHSVTAVINGFTSVPSREQINRMIKTYKGIKEDAVETVRLFAKHEDIDFTNKNECVSLTHQDRYPVNQGRITTPEGLDASELEYRRFFEEEQVSYSNAKKSVIIGRGHFMVGALARLNNAFNKLSSDTKDLAKEIGLKVPDYNPFHNNIAQTLEVLNGIDDVIEHLEKIDPKREDKAFRVKPGQAGALTEAPRGTVYHEYSINAKGTIEKADIVTPTSHSFTNMEKDLQAFVDKHMDLSVDELRFLCERLVRSYDPCYSCSVH